MQPHSRLRVLSRLPTDENQPEVGLQRLRELSTMSYGCTMYALPLLELISLCIP